MRAINAKSRRESLLSEIGRFAILIALAGFFTVAWGPGSAAAAPQMEDYCQIPAYVKRDVAPNIQILMDNSEDMYDYAHRYDEDPDDGNEDVYDPAKTYIGYFNPSLNYSYGSNVFVEDLGGNFSGNLMNWATMSKYDIVQKVLLGGNTASKQGNAHTLVAISDVWTRTYNGCTFNVDNGTVTISGDTCSLLTGGGGCAGPYPDDSLGKPSGKGVEIIQPNSTTLPDGQVGVCYEFGFQAKGGESTFDSDGKGGNDSARYTWSISANPDTLTIDADSGILHGVPATAGTYPFTVTVDDDGKYAPVTRNVTLVVQPSSGVATEQFTIKVEMEEEPLTDLNGNDIWDRGEIYTDLNGNSQWDGKKGIIQEFWDENEIRARWGMTDFVKTKDALGNDIGMPNNEVCMPASNSSTFYTAIQNATPVTISPLADGLYGVINYFMDEPSRVDPDSFSGCANQDALDDVPCRQNFILVLSSGSNVGATAFPGGGACNEAQPLVQNACYGRNTDLRADWDGKQYVSTYVVQTFGETNTGVLEAAADAGDGEYFLASKSNLEDAIREAFRNMLKRAAAGSAASVLASGEGSGANMLQAIFYPRRKFTDSVTGETSHISWSGRLSSFWYYVDPWFSNAGIREDNHNTASDTLDLAGDNIVQFYFDPIEEKTMAMRWEDTDGDGVGDVQLADKDFEQLDYLWEAGKKLWAKAPADRKIWVNDGGTITQFLDDNATATLLETKLQAADLTDAKNIISYVRGVDDFDIDGDGTPDDVYRSRTVKLGGTSNVWKLGDILSSTPQVVSWMPRMDYHFKYKDTTYGKAMEFPSLELPADNTHFITTADHKDRGTVLVGANDGMLHAFKLGTFEYSWGTQGPTEKARITNTLGIGEEQWAFIPENVLPYLKYLRENDYCHLYSVDLTPYVFDASVGSGLGDQAADTKDPDDWRTIIIGSMRLGGGCADPADACTDCVKRPAANIGYSSYFALDVTDVLADPSLKPDLLWEFTHDDLGFATTGPSVFRVGPKDKNGDWFAVIGSGPTGPIDTNSQQFLGRSNQNLKLFVLNLKSGTLMKTIDTGIAEAFAGTMSESSVDTDLDYQDEAVYAGYVRKDGAGNWETGGVGRMFTGESSDPGDWVWETLTDGIGPVTSKISRIHDKRQGKLWMYWGTGRYFFNTGKTDDDPTNIRRVYGVKEPRYNGAKIGISIGGALGGLDNVTGVLDPAEPTSGWYINLEPSGTYPVGLAGADVKLNAERVITDPLATTLGVTFFVTYMPYQDICAYGGKSFIWALQYNTGGVPKALLRGKALVQTSTGSIEEKDLSQCFTEKGGKRTGVIEGVPPVGQGLSIMTTPAPINRVLHRRER